MNVRFNVLSLTAKFTGQNEKMIARFA